ncbi:MAG: hypothetical protein AVDCRST_MAG69-2096, partial [uncultured Solirubrobacteraceae bacterium]
FPVAGSGRRARGLGHGRGGGHDGLHRVGSRARDGASPARAPRASGCARVDRHAHPRPRDPPGRCLLRGDRDHAAGVRRGPRGGGVGRSAARPACPRQRGGRSGVRRLHAAAGVAGLLRPPGRAAAAGLPPARRGRAAAGDGRAALRRRSGDRAAAGHRLPAGERRGARGDGHRGLHLEHHRAGRGHRRRQRAHRRPGGGRRLAERVPGGGGRRAGRRGNRAGTAADARRRGSRL